MEIMKFKCTLLSDIILSQNSSTKGNQYSLDFIPGNNFLGIVAAFIYNNVEAPARGLTGLTIIKNFKIIAVSEKIFQKYFGSSKKSSTFAPAKRETR